MAYRGVDRITTNIIYYSALKFRLIIILSLVELISYYKQIQSLLTKYVNQNYLLITYQFVILTKLCIKIRDFIQIRI